MLFSFPLPASASLYPPSKSCFPKFLSAITMSSLLFLPILEIYVLSLSNCVGSIGETENELEYWDEKNANETKDWHNLLTFSQGHLLSAHPHNLFSILQEHHCRYHTLDTHFFLVRLIHTVKKKKKKLKLTAIIFLIILSFI